VDDKTCREGCFGRRDRSNNIIKAINSLKTFWYYDNYGIERNTSLERSN
jgi:hypothetical protein